MSQAHTNSSHPALETQDLFTLLDRPIAYHRCFVPLVGVTGAVMLSQALYWTKRTKNSDGWFYKTQEEWEEETGLTRFEQEGARKKLRGARFWKEKLSGVPATLHFRIDMDELAAALASMRKTSNPVCGKPANWYAENQQTISETTTETTTNIPGAALPEPPVPGNESPTPANPSLIAESGNLEMSPTPKRSATERTPPRGAQSRRKRKQEPIGFVAPGLVPSGDPKPERPRDLLWDAVERLTGIDVKVYGASRFARELKPLRAVPDILVKIELFTAWWYANDWRGLKRQPPTMQNIRECWGPFTNYLGLKARREKPQVARPNSATRLEEKWRQMDEDERNSK